MSDSDPIICKPTPWFIWRAILMFAMFAGFAGWFASDGLVGYKKANESFFMKETFDTAQEKFDEMEKGGLTAEQWQAFVSEQKVDYPEDAVDVLPKDASLDTPWPDELKDFEMIRDSKTIAAWETYTGSRKLNSEMSLKAYHDASSIRTQLILSAVCAVFAAVAIFFLLRTIGRKMVADGTSVSLPGAGTIPYAAINRLDKRKWETKGLALLNYDNDGIAGKARVDGLTYGGFKKEEGEPAERLMERIQSSMSGEVIEYLSEDEDDEDAKATSVE